MESMRLEFREEGAVLNLNETITEFNAVVQDTLVNIGTRLETDGLDPERGCSLEKNTLQTGVVVSTASATHVSNIATVETLGYIIETEDANEVHTLADLQLKPISFTLEGLIINTIMASDPGEIRGVTATLAI